MISKGKNMMKQYKITYSATSGGAAAGVGAVLAVGVLAGTAHVVTLELNGELKLSVSGGRVLEDGQPGTAVAETNTQVHGGEVAPGVGVRAPLAGILHGNTGGVDVVLSASLATLPVVVVVGVGAGQRVGLARHGVERNSLALSTGVVGTADGDVLAKLVLDLDLDLVSARHAKLAGHGGVGQVELATLAVDTTNGLASSTLVRRPLGLLVASGAGVGAVSTLSAALAGKGSLDVGVAAHETARLLNASPTTKTHPVNRNRAVVLREVAAVELAIGEILINAGARVVAVVFVVVAGGAVGLGSVLGRSWSRVGRRRSVCARRLNGGRGRKNNGRRGLDPDGGAAGSGCDIGSLGGRRSVAGRRGRGELAVAGHHEAAVLETALDLIFGDQAAIELVDDDGRPRDTDNIDGSRLVTLGVVEVLVAVLVGGGDGSAEGCDNCVLHCRCLRGEAWDWREMLEVVGDVARD